MPHQDYTDSQGNRWPSVTEVLKVVDANWKWAWYYRSVMRWGRRGWHYCIAKSSQGADFGSDVHALLTGMLVKKYPTLKSPGSCVLQSSSKYWEKAAVSAEAMFNYVIESGVKPIVVEEHLLSSQARYHGTTDFVCQVDANTYEIWDWKTGSTVSSDWPLQLSAYAHLWNESHPESPINSGRIVRVDKKLVGIKIKEERYGNLFEKYYEEFLNRRDTWDYVNKEGRWHNEYL